MKHLLFFSFVILAIILPPAVDGLFPLIAVALGVTAIVIAKGIFWGAVVGGLLSAGNNRNYGYRTPHSYHYRTYSYGRRRRSALSEFPQGPLNAQQRDQWFADISTQDEDDCGKRLVCELTARHALNATKLADDEVAIVKTFIEEIDVKKGQVEFVVASKVGWKEGELRCAELYRRCNIATDTTMALIRAELQQINKIATSPTFINKIPSGQPQKPQTWFGRQ